MDKLTKIKILHTHFKGYLGDMKNVWEEYSYLVYLIESTETQAFEIESLFTNRTHPKTKEHAGGMRTRFMRGVNTKNHYIDAIGIFENYIASLVEFVYWDYPYKIGPKDKDNSQDKLFDLKLFELILNSEDKQAMLDSLIEEKIRSIFYGNPLDVFEKDKCKLELGRIFKDTYGAAMPLYREIVGRRNVLIHNSGRVDKKFLRENKNSPLQEGRKVVISEDYLRGTIGLLIGIAAVTTRCVIERIYKGDIQGTLSKSLSTFDKCLDNDWFKNLLS